VTARITTLFCDVGGVLIENPWVFVSQELGKKYHVDSQQLFHDLMELSVELDKNQLTLYKFSRRISDYLSRSLSYAYFEKLFLGPSLRQIPVVWDSVRELKNSADLTIFAVSNMSKLAWKSLQRRFDIDSLFDGTVLSYECRIAKPDPGIFELALRRAESEPGESLLLDDLAENIAAARGLGIRTHLATFPPETAEFLRTLRRKPAAGMLTKTTHDS